MNPTVRAIALYNIEQCMAFELNTGMRMTAAADPFAIARKHLGISTRSKQRVYAAFVAAMPALLAACSDTDGKPLATKQVDTTDVQLSSDVTTTTDPYGDNEEP